MRHIGRSATAVLVLSAGLMAPVLTAGPALAKGGHGDRVEARGTCHGGGTWKLKAKPDDGRLEVELEVDTNRKGQIWTVKISDNGHRVFSGKRTTKAPSGSFSVERRTPNRAGKDFIRATATRGSHSCSARIAI